MKPYDIAIIGAGPAGLAAAAFAANVQLNVAIVAPDMGGKVSSNFGMNATTPVNSVWGVDLVNQLAEFVQAKGVERISDTMRCVQKTEKGWFDVELASSDKHIRARTLIVSTGVMPRHLYIPGQLDLWGKGVSYSALSHASVVQGKDVLVIGYNNRALLALLKLAALAHHIYWLPVGVKDASEELLAQVERYRNIERINEWRIQRIIGDESVRQVELAKDYDVWLIDVAGVFIELGWIANTEFLSGLIQLEEENGHIPVNSRCETELPGLFAAGDVTTVFAEQVPIAIGEGMKAAISAWEYCISESE